MTVVVVGLGAMGSAALAHLARRGLAPIGIEQFAVGHERGSSHGWSRVVRQAYFEHPDYVPLLKRAFALWEELEADTGADILHRNGVLILGPPDSAAIRLSRESARLHDVLVEDVSPAEVASRYAQFSVPDDFHGLLEPGGGFAIPEHGNAAHLDVAVRHGASIRPGVAVTSIARDGDGVKVETTAGPVLADHVVVTAGAWTAELLLDLGVELQPQRKTLVWFEPADAAACSADRMPVWLVDDENRRDGGVYYGVPTWPGQVGPPGVKVGFHGPGVATDPGLVPPVSARELRRFEEDMRALLPVVGRASSSTRCMYTMSPDEHFVVGASGIENVTVAAGFSGHGYKFAPAIGEVLADLAMGRETKTDVRFLSADRFAAAR